MPALVLRARSAAMVSVIDGLRALLLWGSAFTAAERAALADAVGQVAPFEASDLVESPMNDRRFT